MTQKYTYTGSGSHVTRTPEGRRLRVYPGQPFVPSDAELRAFSDLLTPVDADASAPAAATADNEPDPVDDASEDVSDADLVRDHYGIDPDDYTALRKAATEYDDIKGNWPADEIIGALAEQARRGD